MGIIPLTERPKDLRAVDQARLTIEAVHVSRPGDELQYGGAEGLAYSVVSGIMRVRRGTPRPGGEAPLPLKPTEGKYAKLVVRLGGNEPPEFGEVRITGRNLALRFSGLHTGRLVIDRSTEPGDNLRKIEIEDCTIGEMEASVAGGTVGLSRVTFKSPSRLLVTPGTNLSIQNTDGPLGPIFTSSDELLAAALL